MNTSPPVKASSMIMSGSTDELGDGELPAEQHQHDDARLDDEVGRGDHEHHGAGEVGPLATSDRAMADAAYEQEDETMPKPVARATAAGRWSPSEARIWSFDTNAWTAPDSVKPRTRAHRVSQNM